MRPLPFPFAAAAVAVVTIGVAGCSLTGLDRFGWPECGACDELNERDGIDTDRAAMVWQCPAGGAGLCELRAPDLDGDGRIALGRGGDDCDDANPDVFPGAPETCNGLDDDCNTVIDDGSSALAAEPAIEILAAPTSPSWASYHASGGELVMAYETSAGLGSGGGLERVRSAAPITTGSLALALASTAPDHAVSVSATEPGCAVLAVTPRPLARCAAGGVCEAPEICVTSVGGDALCGTPISPSPPPGRCNTAEECDDGVFCNGAELCQPASPLSDAFGCRSMVVAACSADEACSEEDRTCSRVTSQSCGVSDLAFAPAGDDWLAVSIATMGCEAGVLRAGYLGLSPRSPETRFPTPGTIVQRGDRDGLRGAGWRGIDLADGTLCPGPESGRDVGAPRGASGPSIAALPGRAVEGRFRPQGLVAYLAAPACRALGCGSTPPLGAEGSVDVELVGLWLEEGAAGSDRVAWVNATGTGSPTRLGVRTSARTTRPQVLSWSATERDGYLVAYPLESGGVAVHVVPALIDPSPRCDGAARPCISDIEPHPTQLGTVSRTTPELVIPAAQTLFETTSIPGDVVIALHGGEPVEGAPMGLAFAWIEGARIAIARATFDPASGMVVAGDVEHVTANDARELAIAYVPRGLISDVQLDGAPSDPALRGGFVVTWTEGPVLPAHQEHVWAARVSDDAGVIAPGAVRLTPELDDDPVRTAARPRAFVDEDGRLRVVAHVDDAIVVFPSVCGTGR